jgi:hypothetical protein
MTYFYKTVSKLLVALLFITGSQQLIAATFTVTNTDDGGPGSLRDAITQANGNGVADDIVFNIPGTGPFTINLVTGLPVIINEPLFINGYSQPGATAGPIGTRAIMIEINGAAIPGGSDMLVIGTSNVTIAGLAIYSCPTYGITIGSNLSNIHIWGNNIGTNATGTATLLGNQGGIISNFGAGIGTPNINVIVGTDGDGTDDANEGNLVCANTGSGLAGFGIVFWHNQGSTIAGNIIGLDKDGNAVTGLGNIQDGILLTVESSGCIVGTDGDGISDNFEGNMIASSGTNGILAGGRCNNTIIAGNRIGLDILNNAAGNGTYGIDVINGTGLQIGTNGDGLSDNLEPNIITSNGRGGIRITTDDFFGYNGSSDNNKVSGNIIGTDAALTLNLGNTGSGILLKSVLTAESVSDNIIGSDNDAANDAFEGNVIAFNDTGISMVAAAGTIAGNKISRNSIYGNDQLGIDLAQDGVTINDNGDVDAGVNDLFNSPVLVTMQIQGTNLLVTGFSVPNSVIEFYVGDGATNPNPLPGGFTRSFGEGRTFLFRAQDDATLDGVTDIDLTTSNYDGTMEGTGTGGSRTENRFSFLVDISTLPVAVTSGTRITALAYANTTGAGSTSEFSGTMFASSLPVTLTSFKGRIDGDKAELSWSTADEINNRHFEVERSANGQAYAKIGTVQGIGGTNNAYQFTDNGPLSTTNYYRLKQVDVDGKSTYTRALVLRKDLNGITAKAAPSPFTGFINISYKLQQSENIRIRMIDQIGRVVKTYSTRGGVGVNTFNLNGLDHLPKGNYMVELSGETVLFRQQVMKR